MAVTVGMSGQPTTVHDEFEVTSMDRPDVESVVSEIEKALRSAGEERRNVILAALAEVSAAYINQRREDGDDKTGATVREQEVDYGR